MLQCCNSYFTVIGYTDSLMYLKMSSSLKVQNINVTQTWMQPGCMNSCMKPGCLYISIQLSHNLVACHLTPTFESATKKKWIASTVWSTLLIVFLLYWLSSIYSYFLCDYPACSYQLKCQIQAKYWVANNEKKTCINVQKNCISVCKCTWMYAKNISVPKGCFQCSYSTLSNVPTKY